MFTVTEIFRSDHRVKGSKFLGFLSPAANLPEAERVLELVKNEHPSATHHCYAYILNPGEPVEFANDDGEPNGTAGLPILNIIRSYEFINVLLIVVRYYGGTKLGKAGLIDAYGTCAKEAAETANLKRIKPVQIYTINYAYNDQSYIDKLKNSFSLIEFEAEYLETVTLSIGCNLEDAAKFEKAVQKFRHLLNEFKIEGKSFHILE
ncbi:MAG: YigZ family protein [Balneolaceae bacterium]|nr:YigZ family protein [Balneolaceae bacterium]